jgi:carbon monoxide dehydrogenase subunit G
MPGATLLTVDGDEFTGTVKVKVGPIQVTYKGQAKFVEKDDGAHRAVIEASGKEARGAGTAAATVTTQLLSDGDATKVTVSTDLNVTGRPAQFGRGVMSEVAAKLINQFATCLEHEVGAAGEAATVAEAAQGAHEVAAAAPSPAPATSAPSVPPAAGGMTEPAPAPAPALPAASSGEAVAAATPSGPRPVAPVERKPHHASDVLDLVEQAGGSVAKRVVPVVAAVAVAALLWRRRRR